MKANGRRVRRFVLYRVPGETGRRGIELFDIAFLVHAIQQAEDGLEMNARQSVPNDLPDDIFLFGASCAPYAKGMDWPIEEWDRDLATMRSLHFNTVRIFAPWDRIEVKEGVFDYGKQDYLFDLAGKHGMRVILNFGGLFSQLCGLYLPRHLAHDGCCQVRMNTTGVEATSDEPQMCICMDDPGYRKKAFAFMERTVRRYADRDELLAWMIWNEPASPFCYCPHTQAKFRAWVREKYGTLDRLNAVWGTEGPLNYTDWEQIKAPHHSHILSLWYDWVRFTHARLYEAMSEITALTLRCDPRKRPTTSNLVYHMAALEGTLATPRYGLDVGRVGQSMSIMGVSCYTVEHLHDVNPGYVTAYKLSRLRSASQDEHRRMLVLETGVGPNLRMITEAQRIQTFWHLIAHNAKSIVLWNYRSRLSDSQVALFHLMKWDGTVSRRAAYMGKFSEMLQTHAKLLNNVYPERQAAILTLEDEQIQSEAICGTYYPFHYSEYHNSRLGAYKMLWDMQIPADCIAENNLDELSRYKLLLLPMAEHITPDLADRIKRFVAAGGTVIAESPFAFRDDQGMLQYQAPAFGLKEVFGCSTSDREGKETGPAIICPEGQAQVMFFWSEYELSGGEALARYDKIGTAAVVRHRYGKGTAIVVGTEVFRQYVKNEQPAMTRLLQNEITASGVQPTARLSGECDNIEVSRLSGDGGLLYVITNHNETSRHFQMELPELDTRWINMQTGQYADFSGRIRLQGKEVLAIKRDAVMSAKEPALSRPEVDSKVKKNTSKRVAVQLVK